MQMLVSRLEFQDPRVGVGADHICTYPVSLRGRIGAGYAENRCSAVEKKKGTESRQEQRERGRRKKDGQSLRVNRGPKGQRKGINMADAASFMYLYWPLARWACRDGWAQALVVLRPLLRRRTGTFAR